MEHVPVYSWFGAMTFNMQQILCQCCTAETVQHSLCLAFRILERATYCIFPSLDMLAVLADSLPYPALVKLILQAQSTYRLASKKTEITIGCPLQGRNWNSSFGLNWICTVRWKLMAMMQASLLPWLMCNFLRIITWLEVWQSKFYKTLDSQVNKISSGLAIIPSLDSRPNPPTLIGCGHVLCPSFHVARNSDVDSSLAMPDYCVGM